MDKTYKKEFHYFVLTDYEKEEVYLRKMHKNGWRFIKVTIPGIYYFEACEPEDVVYKLDFNPQKSEDEAGYRRIYEDYGWKYIQDLNEYSYFYKKASDAVTDDELEIFSDNESKLKMLHHIFTRKMLPILCIFLLLVIPQFINLCCNEVNSITMGFLCGWLFLFCIYVYLIGRCGVGFYHLRRKYAQKV